MVQAGAGSVSVLGNPWVLNPDGCQNEIGLCDGRSRALLASSPPSRQTERTCKPTKPRGKAAEPACPPARRSQWEPASGTGTNARDGRGWGEAASCKIQARAGAACQNLSAHVQGAA